MIICITAIDVLQAVPLALFRLTLDAGGVHDYRESIEARVIIYFDD